MMNARALKREERCGFEVSSHRRGVAVHNSGGRFRPPRSRGAVLAYTGNSLELMNCLRYGRKQVASAYTLDAWGVAS